MWQSTSLIYLLSFNSIHKQIYKITYLNSQMAEMFFKCLLFTTDSILKFYIMQGIL